MIIRLAWKQASPYGEASTYQIPPTMNTSCYYLDGLENKKERNTYLGCNTPIRPIPPSNPARPNFPFEPNGPAWDGGADTAGSHVSCWLVRLSSGCCVSGKRAPLASLNVLPCIFPIPRDARSQQNDPLSTPRISSTNQTNLKIRIALAGVFKSLSVLRSTAHLADPHPLHHSRLPASATTRGKSFQRRGQLRVGAAPTPLRLGRKLRRVSAELQVTWVEGEDHWVTGISPPRNRI